MKILKLELSTNNSLDVYGQIPSYYISLYAS